MERRPNPKKGVLSVLEVAAILDIGIPNAYVLCRSPGFPSFTIGRRILTPKMAFERWLREQDGTQFYESDYRERRRRKSATHH